MEAATAMTRETAISSLASDLQRNLMREEAGQEIPGLSEKQRDLVARFKTEFCHQIPNRPERPLRIFRIRGNQQHPFFHELLMFLLKEEKLVAAANQDGEFVELVIY
mgnify:CR=1 FL=1